MTMDEINQVEHAMEGFYVGYATVSSLKGNCTGRYVFNMTPENISGFLYRWKDRAGQVLLTDMLDRPLLKMESGCITQCKTYELEFCPVCQKNYFMAGEQIPCPICGTKPEEVEHADTESECRPVESGGV